ncbi:MAG: SRPBCC domain-containing protein [Polyangiaceae bacterium]|nr:SRPBCC domain-containing protein [Myxococcales bacterium]MCB9586387.1 SRPBCC domain-containing protein [Polyangiaceae bacterium]
MTEAASETETTNSHTIEVDYFIDAPPPRVWRALTDPKLLAAWLMENDIRAEVGHRFTFRAKPMPGWDGVVQCEVLEVDEPHLLRYSWRGGSEEHRLDTIVTWRLRPAEDGGTRLRLEHSGFRPQDAFALEGLARGWRGKVAERITELLTSEG